VSAHKQSLLAKISNLWAAGFTTDRIAAELSMTKGSVCRMAREARMSGDPRFPPRNSGRGVAPGVGPQPVIVEVPPRLKPMLCDLKPGCCKWTVWSGESRGEHHFCAEPQFPGSPYCKKHRALATSLTRGAPALTTWVKVP
jgi:hypothetical protein